MTIRNNAPSGVCIEVLLRDCAEITCEVSSQAVTEHFFRKEAD